MDGNNGLAEKRENGRIIPGLSHKQTQPGPTSALTELHRLRQLDGLPCPGSVDGRHPEPVAAARDQVVHRVLCVADRLGVARQPEGAVGHPHLQPVAQDGAAAVVQRGEPGEGDGGLGLTQDLGVLGRVGHSCFGGTGSESYRRVL